MLCFETVEIFPLVFSCILPFHKHTISFFLQKFCKKMRTQSRVAVPAFSILVNDEIICQGDWEHSHVLLVTPVGKRNDVSVENYRSSNTLPSHQAPALHVVSELLCNTLEGAGKGCPVWHWPDFHCGEASVSPLANHHTVSSRTLHTCAMPVLPTHHYTFQLFQQTETMSAWIPSIIWLK